MIAAIAIRVILRSEDIKDKFFEGIEKVKKQVANSTGQKRHYQFLLKQ
jgi:hypothetical protein